MADETDEPDEKSAEAPDETDEAGAASAAEPVTLSKADRLQAKADRLREREAEKTARREAEAKARAGASGHGTGWVVATAVLSAVSAIAIVLLILGFVVWSDNRDDLNRERSLDNARTAAVSAAKSWAVDFGSYDYRHLDADFAKTTAVMTKSFAAEYKKTSTALAPTFTAYKTSVTASVPQAAAVSVSTSKAVVLVLLDQVITSTQSSTPKINRNRLQVTLVHQGGKWLVDKTDAT